MLFALMLCLQWTAWGQATYDYRYWFDQDNTDQHTGTSYSASWQMEVDVSQLSHTYHSIHMQVKDTAGVWSQPVTRYFIKMPVPSESRGYYWLNDDIKAKTETAVENGTLNIDVSALDNKLHYIHYQRNDAYNNTTTPLTGYFMKMPDKNSKKTFRYWTDDDFDNVKTAECTDGVMMLDMSGKKDGFHLLYVMGEMDGEQTQIESRVFIKIPQTEGVSELTCLCYIDGTLYKQEDVPASGGVVDWNLDVASLANGFHRIQVQVVTPTGAATDVHDGFFFRTTMDGELGNMKLVYNVDGGEYKSLEGNFGAGLFHFDLDVSELKDGIHRLNYMLMSETGTSTKVNTSFFIKTPVGGPGIASYKYWVNDNDGEAVKVTIDKRQELFSLISLLPVKAQPIRSSCFHFEIADDGTPMMYAKNDFHIQFVDVKYYHLDAVRQYVDYNVGQAVDDITLLESGESKTIEKPTENEVKWFKIEACEGDTIAFRSNQATSIQVFSPTGKEIYSVSGYESTNWSGCHTWEDGVHYVAVHDVQGIQTNVTLEYMHMDKYDVVDQDVKVVGNGGCSTITFKGNGFRDLYAVTLCNEQGDSIRHDYIAYENDATVSVVFNFDNQLTGNYNAKFKFIGEDKSYNNIVEVEEAKNIELETTVAYPSQFLRGTSVTYVIKIENKGNMTAYYVPLELKLITNSINDISEINFDGFLDSQCQTDMLLTDSLDNEVLEAIRMAEKEASDLSQFVIYRDSIDKVYYGLSQIILTLPPNTTKQFSISIKSRTKVSLEAYMTKDWFPLKSIEVNSNSKRMLLKVADKEWMCCQRQRFECGADAIASIVGLFLPPGANCALSLSMTGIETAYDVWCSEGANYSDQWNNYLKTQGNSLAKRLIQSAINCVTAHFRFLKKKLMDDREMAAKLGSTMEVKRINSEIAALRAIELSTIRKIYDGIVTTVIGAECKEAFSKTKPKCPRNPGGGGGSSSPVTSWDPNDIKGYRAESGSKAVKKGQNELYYTIEFENDTAFATASAQDVYLTDTLNGQYLDLESFAPTSLKIGDKKVELDGKPNFVTTVDMRPSINAIAQVECNYNSKTGIAKWHFTSLDPMTMEHVETSMDGFLPINNSDGDGMGEVSFNINLKDEFVDGTEIKNHASIVFDYNDAIITPTWTNVIDATAPISRAADIEHSSDSTAVLSIEATDELSGMWRYDVYVQYGSGAWFLAAENVPADTTATVKIYEGIDHGFYVVATDSAGNVEQKEPMRELSYNLTSVLKGDANDDGRVSIVDVTMTINAILNRKDDNFNAEAADMNVDGRISIVDATMIINVILNK